MTQWIVSSSVLILVIIALRFFLRRRVKPLLQYGIWALVLVRLLLPFQLGSTPISIENAVEKAPLVQEMSYAQQVTHFDYHPDGSATGYYTFSPVLDHDSGTHNEPVPELFTHAEADRIANLRTAKQHLTSLWIGGMIAMGAVFLISNGVFALRLKKSRKLLEKGRLSVYETSVVETPCYFGMLRPAIYLPPAVAAEERHRIFAVTHELTHYRHGDELWAALRCLCLVIHWYNPLVWLAAILSREDCEIACDESTIATLGESHRTEYGRVLIDLTCRRYTDLLRTATTMTGSAIGLKDRIKMIVKKPKTAIYALIAVILVAAISVGCTFTGSSGRSANMPTGSQTEPTLSDTHPTENQTAATTPSETTVPAPTACSHSFRDATCQTPKTCSKCGETEGSTIDHAYSQATCLTPQTCTVCGATHGSTSDHTWYGATCLQEGICTVCGIIGEKGKHNYVATDPTSSSGNFACSVCGIARRQASTDNYVFDLNEIAENIANYAKQQGFQVVVEGVLSADYTSRYIYLSTADIYSQGPAYLTGLGIDLVNTAYANYAQSPLGIGAYTLHIEVDTVLNSVYGAGLGVQIAVTS